MSDCIDTEKLFETMKRRGLRVTLPRRAVLEVLKASEDYPSAEEIFIRVHAAHPKIGLATVYRTLTMLANLGIVTRFEFGQGKARYELAEGGPEATHHHVIVCEHCFKVIKYSDFTDAEKRTFRLLEEQLESKFDFAIDRHVVHYYGVCSHCRG